MRFKSQPVPPVPKQVWMALDNNGVTTIYHNGAVFTHMFYKLDADGRIGRLMAKLNEINYEG